jgi:hypothetical protein
VNAYLTLDVDPDFTNPNKGIQKAKQGINSCLHIFKEFSLEEYITWLVNNTQLKLTSQNSYLSKMSAGEIGLHLHLNHPPWSESFFYLPRNEKIIYNTIEKEKKILEEWTLKHLGREIVSFRSGDLLTDQRLFRILNQLNIKIDSSIPSQFDWSLKEILRKILIHSPLKIKLVLSKILVNKRIYPTLPLGSKPFVVEGILEMPIHIYLGRKNIINRASWIKERTQKQLKMGVKDLVIYWHPFEVLGNEKKYSEYIEYLLEKKFTFRRLNNYIIKNESKS